MLATAYPRPASQAIGQSAFEPLFQSGPWIHATSGIAGAAGVGQMDVEPLPCVARERVGQVAVDDDAVFGRRRTG